ncbi:MAG: MerR family transcriptional regulator [Lachnospiraceae bacterium]|nr:MerR family transcriptional regulator [Lachnospiraceae bacterium]
MGEYRTLQEIHHLLGVSRRAVQGYEKLGLVAASGKNKYGYLLYGEDEVKRIDTIKKYQQFGFKLKEIKVLIDAPDQIVKEALERRVEQLREEQVKLKALMIEAEVLIEKLSGG